MRARALAFVVLGLFLGGCMQTTLEPSNDLAMKPRDKQLLANAPYQQATIPEPYRRHIVDYHRKEAPGTIVVDSDSRFLYYVMPAGKAIRYGVTVGDEALVFSGVAKVGNLAEWPNWTPTADIRKRMGDLPPMVTAARTIRSARARSISTKATRTRCTAFTAPTSRNTSVTRFRPAASA